MNVYFVLLHTGLKPTGDTNFGNAMKLAESCVERFGEQTAIIFLTDGQSSDSKATEDDSETNVVASERLKRLKENCSNFQFYPIRFGKGWFTRLFVDGLATMAQAVETTVIDATNGTNDNKSNDDDEKSINPLVRSVGRDLTDHLEAIADDIADTSLLIFKKKNVAQNHT